MIRRSSTRSWLPCHALSEEMSMSLSLALVRCLRRLCAAVLLTVLVAPALGGTLDPNGNPRYGGKEDPMFGSAYSADGLYKVSLGPNPALYMPMGSCAWLVPALNKLNFNEKNGWNISYKTLEGSLKITDYVAWADKDPDLKLGDKEFKGGDAKGDGGAGFVLNYNPKGKDPVPNGEKDASKANIKWIQVIDTNKPNDRANKYGEKLADSSIAYLDNQRYDDGRAI